MSRKDEGTVDATTGGGDNILAFRQEVDTLKKDVEYIRSTTRDMQEEVRCAVLLLSRFIGVQQGTGEAVRLVEEQSASASNAVDRLANEISNLEQQIDAAAPASISPTERGSGEASTR